MIWQCENCGKDFAARPSRPHRVCSLLCRYALKRAQSTQPCEQCGKPVYRPPAHAARGRIYCSHRCHGLAIRGDAHPAFAGEKPRCIGCGKTIHGAWGKRRATAQWCSHECRRKNQQHPRGLPYRIPCSQCGTPLWVGKIRFDHGRCFCTRRCANLAHREDIKGTRNGRYKHGLGTQEYPAEFVELSKLVRRRDGYVCRLCQMTKAENGGKAMSVHHVDGNVRNNSMKNAISLCGSCHASVHGGPKLENLWREILSSMLAQDLCASESIA